MTKQDGSVDDAADADLTEAASSGNSREAQEPVGFQRELRSFLELLALTTIAVAQPVFDLLRNNVDLFVAHRSGRVEIVTLAVLVALGPPLALWLVEVFVGWVIPRSRRPVHAVLLGLLFGLFLMEVAKQSTEFGTALLLAVGGVACVAAAIAVYRSEAVRSGLQVLSAAIVVFVLLFLAVAPVSGFLSDPNTNVAGVTIAEPKRVVMIVADEFPLGSLLDGTGRVDRELFPNLAALADTSTWYRNTTSVSPFTEWAVPSLVTGLNPRDANAIPFASDHENSIFRLLGGTYRMNVHEPVTYLCPDTLCRRKQAGDFVDRMEGLTRSTASLYGEFASPERPPPVSFDGFLELDPQLELALRYIDTLRASARPTFDYFHLLLPHLPWRYFPSLQDSGYTKKDPFKQSNPLVWGSDGVAAIGRQRHILQVMALDTVLGRLFQRLKDIGEWDDSVVVLTSDHGEAFRGQKPMRTATDETADQLLWVPLFMKDSGQVTGRVDDRPAQTIDVVPTIAELIGTEIPWDVDGVSLLGPVRPEFPRPFYQWFVPDFSPEGYPEARPGEFLTYDPEPLFKKVLAARAAPPGGVAALRPYRISPYGGLIGKDPQPLVRPDAPGPDTFYLPPGMRDPIDPKAAVVPWTWIQQQMSGVERSGWIAFAVNGRIAGIGYLGQFEGKREGYYYAVLAPEFFKSGVNSIAAYAPSGPPQNPVLKEIALGN